MRQIESGAYPYLLEHARQHDADHPQTSFEFVEDQIEPESESVEDRD